MENRPPYWSIYYNRGDVKINLVNRLKIENAIPGGGGMERVENKLISDHREEDFNGIFSTVVVNRADPSRDRDRFVPYRFVFRLRIHGYFNELSAMDGFVAGPLSPRARSIASISADHDGLKRE